MPFQCCSAVMWSVIHYPMNYGFIRFAREAQEKKVVKLTFSLFMGLEEGCYVHSEKAEDISSFIFDPVVILWSLKLSNCFNC